MDEIDDDLDFLSSRFAEYSGLPQMNILNNRPEGRASQRNKD